VPHTPIAAALWLDGRDMVRDAGAMTLRAAVFDKAGVVGSMLLDPMVCDCCQTDVAIATSGPVAVYRNRTAEEIRDIHVTRAVGGAWEPDRSVSDDGWRIAGCPVNGPAIAARGDRVVVAWYTAAQDRPRVRVAFSADSAASFGAAMDVAEGNPSGRVDVVLDAAGDAIVSWLEPPPDPAQVDSAELKVRRVTAFAPSARSYVVAGTGAGRPAGFPQMVLHGDRLLFAWTDTREEPATVRSASVPAAAVR
jgi:hypothetical protein